MSTFFSDQSSNFEKHYHMLPFVCSNRKRSDCENIAEKCISGIPSLFLQRVQIMPFIFTYTRIRCTHY